MYKRQLEGEHCSRPASQKGSRIYLYIMPDMDGEIRLDTARTVTEAHILDSGEPVAFHRQKDGGYGFAEPFALADGTVRVISVAVE